ncbi:MAG: DNA translocase FtsK 4TM domain-containing protein [Sedimentisphaerales bacterium]|nr:DNA translocase FtsK 4TM domain-containing protein [Sedimentisphaerales bacterium]
MRKRLKTGRNHTPQANTASLKVAGDCLLILAGIGLLLSCLSFDIGDWPSRYTYPHNHPPANWCGHIGAFAAYWLLYFLGPGVLPLIACMTGYGVMRLLDRTVNQLVLRSIGLGLIVLATSVTFYCLWPDRVLRFPFGSGGVLGVAVAAFLSRNLAVVGSTIFITGLWVVGLLLLADEWVMAVPKGIWRLVSLIAGLLRGRSSRQASGQQTSAIWRRLSERQKVASEPSGTPAQASATQEAEPKDRADQQIQPVPILVKSERGQQASEKASRQRPQTSGSQAGEGPYKDYRLPPLDLLAEPQHGYEAVQERLVQAKAAALEKLLGEFNISAKVVAAETGPVVTMFELELAAGIKVSQVAALANDMARALGVGAVRVVAPLAGKHTIGVEVPNSQKEKVRMRSMMDLAGQVPASMAIPLFLGKDSSGEALVADLTKMPHLLIAGTTGSGKSVCINSIITSILMTKRPDEVKLILIDPKMVEMTTFATVAHLMCPIVTETQMAVQILEWAATKMDERYALLAEARVKNIAEYNALGPEEIVNRFSPSSPEEEAKIPKRLPYIVIIIDELADLMMTAPKDIEAFIVRLAQKSRAVGIHLVLATQRPQATVVTGLIKSNMPTRIAFRVAARMDSRIILDQNGAETLLGEGDMLFLKPGTSDLIRAQGTLVDEAEVKRIVTYLKEVAEPQFHPELVQLRTVDPEKIEKDELFDQAVRIVLETRRGSVSLLQRRLSIGYARASRIIEMMAAAGILGEYKGSQAREVLMTLEEYEALCERMKADQQAGFKDLADQPANAQADRTSEPAGTTAD